MIDVRLFAALSMHSTTGRKRFEMESRPGLTVREVIEAEGLKPGDVHLVMINGLRGTMESELRDGDRLSFFPPLGGG
ncbi:MAG: MoaD/ThiS family protein [Actinobacteria bacterium]|nr:MoaD/ThiS family protein [Actinomycetota bacterium]